MATILFQGANINASILIQNIQILEQGTTSSGSYSYDMCKQEAVNLGFPYFALQNVNLSTNLGYCGVSQSEINVTQPGISYVPTAQVPLWSSSTSGQTGNTAILTNVGSLSVINSNGTSVYSTPMTTTIPSNYLGCYGDGPNRAMALYNNGSQQYSNSQCQQIAQQNGATYYGLQNSTSGTTAQCALSSNLSQTTGYGKASNCTQLTDGSLSGSFSGGGWSNAVYNTTNPSSIYFLILQDDGNMVIYRGSGPNDNQGVVWASNTQNQQQQSNSAYSSANGKYGQNWISSGSTLAPGDFVGSTNGSMALIMQSDGNLVLYTFKNAINCQKMSDGNMGGGVGANALNKLNETGYQSNMAQLAYVDPNSEIHMYPSSNIELTTNYTEFTQTNSIGNDIEGVSYGNATVEQCKETCNANSNCYGFVMGSEGNVCIPKTSSMYPAGNKQYDSNFTTYVRERQPMNPPIGVSYNVNNTDSITFQNYVNGGNFQTSYGLANASAEQKQQLQKMETELNTLASQISTLNTTLNDNNKLTNNQSSINLTGINTYLSDLKSVYNKLTNVSNNNNVENILNDSDIVVLQQNYDYLFWAIIASSVVLISMNILK
jgi:hypothetical protein